jgi:hypothetical protein
MRRNQFNASKPKKAQRILAIPALSQGPRGLPKVSLSVQLNPSTPVRANYKPRARQTDAERSKGDNVEASTSRGPAFPSMSWDPLADEPRVVIQDMDFEPASGWKPDTKVHITLSVRTVVLTTKH